MAIAEKFMFDTRFDEIDGLSLNNQENGMSNSLLQDENSKSNNDSKIEKELEEEKRIAQIREEHYQTGKNDGVAEALIGIEANISKTLSIISDKINELIRNKTISGGMIPKINNCLDVASNGVKGVCIIDGRLDHSILFELLSNAGSGTLIRE